MPLVETYQPKVVLPCHHDDLYPVFIDLATEPLKMRVHEELRLEQGTSPVSAARGQLIGCVPQTELHDDA